MSAIILRTEFRRHCDVRRKRSSCSHYCIHILTGDSRPSRQNSEFIHSAALDSRGGVHHGRGSL
jgi:hypothetical protein